MVNGGAFLDDGYVQLLGILRTHYEKKTQKLPYWRSWPIFSYACLVYLVKEKNVGIAKNLVNPTAEWTHRLSLQSLFWCHFHGHMCPLHLYSSGFVFSFIILIEYTSYYNFAILEI